MLNVCVLTDIPAVHVPGAALTIRVSADAQLISCKINGSETGSHQRLNSL